MRLKTIENVDESKEKKHNSDLKTQKLKEDRRQNFKFLYFMSDVTRAGHDAYMR